MSAINTDSIDVNYPYPKVNNSSQGFRDNFSSIKTNLNTAGTELSELQHKSIVKSSVVGMPIDNNMNNTQVSNALTLGFRNTTFNLSNTLTGVVNIDITKGDVQYGTITGDITLKFLKWAPSGTQSNVQVHLTISNPAASWKIYFQDNVTDGLTTLEQYTGTGIGGYITVPTGVSKLYFNFTTINCGTDIEVQPLNRPRIDYNDLGPGGETTYVQYNYNNLFTGNENFTFNNSTNTVTIGANVIPKTTDTHDIGSNTLKWNDLYLNGTTIYLNNSTIKSTNNGEIDFSENKSVILPVGTPTGTGTPGDQYGMIKISFPYIYVCTANYDGVTTIWKKATLSTY